MAAKTFRFVGYSTLNGKTAVRYANDKGRARVLERNGHEFIQMFDAGEALHPMDLVDLLLNRVDSGVIASEPARAAVRAEAARLGFQLAA
jgi:hypothetical protein